MKTTLSDIIVRIPMRIKTWGGKKEIIASSNAPGWTPLPPSPHQAMLKALGRAPRWLRLLESGKVATNRQERRLGRTPSHAPQGRGPWMARVTMKELAEQEKLNDSTIYRIFNCSSTRVLPGVSIVPRHSRIAARVSSGS